MKKWRYPFGKPPEAVFLYLGARSGALDLLEIVSWLGSVLSVLNWRSHLFVAGEEPGSTERATMLVLDLASEYLKRHGFANLTVHPLVSLNGGNESESWGLLVDMVKPFQGEARELLSEARLHVAPILAPSPEVASVQALRAAEYFRSRLAIPSFYLRGGILEDLPRHEADGDARYFMDSEGAGIEKLLWKSHVFETVLDRTEDGNGSILQPCRQHLVVDARRGGVFSCFRHWDQDAASEGLTVHDDGAASVPAGPSGVDCAECIADAALSMRDNLAANRREAEGRKVFFKLSLELAGRGMLELGANLAHAAFESSRTDADRTAALIQQALCLRESRRLQQADDTLALAAGFTEDKGQIAYHRGRVQFVWHDYIEALEWYEEALESGSGQIPVEDMCFEMAMCHINIEEYADARPYLDRSDNADDPKAPVAFYRGVCDYGEGEFEAALQWFRKALKLGPAAEDMGRVLFYNGACFKELERYEDAVEVLKEAVAADPEDLANHNLLGFCYYKLKRHEEAVACFLRAVEIDPSSGIDWANLASNLRDLGRVKEAIAMYKKALILDPSIGFARENLKTLGG